jgi:hypothetical protein
LKVKAIIHFREQWKYSKVRSTKLYQCDFKEEKERRPNDLHGTIEDIVTVYLF